MSLFLHSERLRVRQYWLPLCCPAAAEPPAFGWNADPALWEEWLHRQGLMAIAYRNLRSLELLSLLPPEMAERMEHYYIDCRFSLDRALHTLRQVCGALQQADIGCILLKGPALSVPFYPDPATRPIQDLDLLVREADHIRAAQALETLSYRLDRPEAEYAKGPMTQRLLLPQTKELLPVEVHWDVVNSRALRQSLGLTFEHAALTACEASHLAPGVRVLAPPLQFVHTCVHAVHQHQLSRLIWLVDVLQSVRCQPSAAESWVEMFCATASSGVQCAVYACLERAKALWPTQKIPSVQRLRPPSALVRSLLGALTAEALIVPEAPAVRWRRKLFRVALRSRSTP